MKPPKREQTIFTEALRLPPEERAAYLSQATAGNPELRREVESLLQNYAAGGFLEEAAAAELRPTVAAAPVTERPGEVIGRYKVGFAATAAVMVALASGLVVAGWMFFQERAALRRAVAAEQAQLRLRQAAETEAAKSEQISRILQEMLQSVGPSVAAGRDTELLKEILDRTEKRLEEELTNQPEVEAELRNIIGTVYFEFGDFDQSEIMFRRSLVLLRQEFGEDHIAVADTLFNLAFVFRTTRAYSKAVDAVRQALAIYDKLLGRQSGKAGASLILLGTSLSDLGKKAEAETVLGESLEINRKAFGEDHPQVGMSLSRLGQILMHQGKLNEAESVLREAVKVQGHAPSGVKQFGMVAAEEELGWTLIYLAEALEIQGNISESEKTRREAVAVIDKVLPKNHRSRWILMHGLANFFLRHGNVEEGVPLYKETLEIWKASVDNQKARLGPNLPETLLSMNNLAWDLATSPYPELRDGSNAVAYAMQAVAATGRTNALYLDTLAAAYAEAGKFDEAVATEKEAMKVVPAGTDNTLYAQCLSLYEASIPYRKHGRLAEYVVSLLGAGKSTEAEPLARECLTLRKKLIPDDWRTCKAMSLLGASLLGQEKYAQAEPLLLDGYKGMMERISHIPAPDRQRVPKALQRLVQLYEDPDRSERAAMWRQKLAEFEASFLAGNSESKAASK